MRHVVVDSVKLDWEFFTKMENMFIWRIFRSFFLLFECSQEEEQQQQVMILLASLLLRLGVFMLSEHKLCGREMEERKWNHDKAKIGRLFNSHPTIVHHEKNFHSIFFVVLLFLFYVKERWKIN